MTRGLSHFSTKHSMLSVSWRWALVSPDGVAPSRMVGVSASVNLPLHHKVQKFYSNTSSPGWSRKKGRKMVVVYGGGVSNYWTTNNFTKCWLISSVCNKHRVLSVFSAIDRNAQCVPVVVHGHRRWQLIRVRISQSY